MKCPGIFVVVAAIGMVSADDAMNFGMKMVSRAHDAVCWYSYLGTVSTIDSGKFGNCNGNVEGQIGNIQLNPDYYNFYPDKLQPDFSSGVKNNALVNLPDVYQSTCGSYLDDSKSNPPSNESEVLRDGGGNYPYMGYSYCLIKATKDNFGKESIEKIKHLIKYGRQKWLEDSMERGMKMMSRAHEAVCWYSYMGNPNMDKEKYGGCQGNVDWEVKNIKMNEGYYKHTPELVEPDFSKKILKNALPNLPDVYLSKCKSFIDDSKAKPPADESEILNDDGKSSYPYQGYNYCLLKTTLDTYGDKSAEDMKYFIKHGRKPWMNDALDRGMKMVSTAHRAVCWYAYMGNIPSQDPDKYNGCPGSVDLEIKNIKINEKYYKVYPELVEPRFSQTVKDNSLVLLPDAYQSKCKSYLTDSKAKPPSDESEVLNDGGGDYPYRGYAYCLMKVTRDTYGKQSMEDTKYFVKYGRKPWMDDSLEKGMKMMGRAHDAVCWFVYLKNFPKTNLDSFGKCNGNAEFQAGNIKLNENYYKTYPEMVEPTFSKSIIDKSLPKLPDVYQSKCKSYLMDSSAKPPSDESEALNDGGGDYRFKAYAYCLLKTTRDTYGNQAIEDIKVERTIGKKDWKQVMLDQENRGRARHGVPPLILLDDLSTNAQAWAQENANVCDMHHSNNATNPDDKFKGETTGENLAAGGGGSDDLDINGYYAVDGWYNEISDNPMSDYMNGKVYNHFTQSIWKGSKYVGYGVATNSNCQKYTRYTAARYIPPGNVQGDSKNNIFPPKD